MKCCYFTVVSSDNYVLGAVGLALSLRQVQSEYPLIIYVTENVSTKALRNFILYQIDYKVMPSLGENQHDNKVYCMDKAYIYTLTDYDRVCWLDADLLVFKNIDYIFEKIRVPGYVYLKDLDENYTNIVPLSGFMFVINPSSYSFEKIIQERKSYQNDEDHYLNLDRKYLESEENVYHNLLRQMNDFSSEVWHSGGGLKWWAGMSLHDVQIFIFNFSLIEKKIYLKHFSKLLDVRTIFLDKYYAALD